MVRLFSRDAVAKSPCTCGSLPGIYKGEVEHLLDYMLDVCSDDRMLNLFNKVCRRYYSLYPEMIASEILAYKEWYED